MNIIQFKLISSYKEIIPKIQKSYDKITALGRLCGIGEGAKTIINQFHQQFINKLKGPFKDFKEN